MGYNFAVVPRWSFDNLLLEREGAVAVVTINRPQVLNALNSSTIDDLRRAALALKHDAAVRAIVITGAGEKSFVAGADINELAVSSSGAGQGAHALRGQHVFDLIENLGKPVIAAINGYALGGGCELAHGVHAARSPRTRRGSVSRRSISASFPAMAARSVCRDSSARVWRSSCC